MSDKPACEHFNFDTVVKIARITNKNGDVTHYGAEIKIKCVDCSVLFEFVGLPLGLSPYRPTVSMDGLEMFAPITPPGTKPADGLLGFSVEILETEQ